MQFYPRLLPLCVAGFVAGLSALAVAGCQSNKPAAERADAKLLKPITVEAVNYAYNPSRITALPGQPVEVTLVNHSGSTHSIVFELPGKTPGVPAVPPGEHGRVQFDAPQKEGTYTFYCPIGSHHEQGMEGQLVVARQP